MSNADRRIRDITFRQATTKDIAAIVQLVNSAYRGELSKKGWTTEADLLGGQRTDAEEVSDLIRTKDSMILLGIEDAQILGCLNLKKTSSGAELGMFAIMPEFQGGGLGSSFITEAEHQVLSRWQSKVLRMQVITLRQDLIAFYERRGYRRTGRFSPFPDSPKFGLPKVADLRLEVLEKPLV
jgi:ribosomal protein S18 acetylase RimI-like enzyme